MKAIRLLVVEDDVDMRQVYVENFPLPQFEIETATNGKEALEILRRSAKAFDWLISDNHMPQMDGITLLRTVHTEFPDLRVVIVTGYGNWSDYVEAHNLNVVKFLDKPVRMQDLTKLIQAH